MIKNQLQNFVTVCDKGIIQILFITSFFLKIFYALTRNIFHSGPDANTFIEMAGDLASEGYFDSSVAGFPIYSPGYPMFLAVNKILFGNIWISSTQVIQSFLTCYSALLAYRIGQHLLNKTLTTAVYILILFHPAFVVLSVSCMYEPVLIYLLILLFKKVFYPGEKNHFFSLLLTSILSILIHPRTIPIIVVILICTIRQSPPKINKWNFVLFVSLNSFFVLIVSMRNYLFSNYFGLAKGVEYGIKFGHPSVGDCSSLSDCLPKGLSQDPLDFTSEMATNLMYFFSPWSGPLERGTWFHNISLYTLLEKEIGEEPVIFVSWFPSVFSVILLIFGFLTAWKKNRDFTVISGLSLVILVATDMLIYGDSRHRLLIIPILYLFQANAIKYVLLNREKNE